MKELKDLKELTEKIRTLYIGYEDVAILLEMGYEEEDPSVVKEIEQEWKKFETLFEELRIQTLLSGEYDSCNAIMTIHAGAGGTEYRGVHPGTPSARNRSCTPYCQKNKEYHRR